MSIHRRSAALSDADIDALLSGRAVPGHDDLHDALAVLRTARSVPAPVPSGALAVVLREGVTPQPAAPTTTPAPWRRWAARTAVAVVAALTTTVGAAAANALPSPVQARVSDVIGAVTPWQLPHPAAAQDDEAPATVPSAPVDEQLPRPTRLMPGTTPPAGVVPPQRPAQQPTTDADEPDTDTDDTDTDEPDTDEPDTDESGPEAPDSDEPETPEPDTGEPETDEPETDEPETDEPQADEPETDEPQADASDPADVEPGPDAAESQD